MKINYQDLKFTVACPCGFTASGYTLAEAGRLIDEHLALQFPIGTQRRPCDPPAVCNATSAAVQKAMEIFELARNFLRLPHHVKTGILRDLNLLGVDSVLRDGFREYFRLAREQGKVEALKAAVSLYGQGA